MTKKNTEKKQNVELVEEARAILARVLKIDPREITSESTLQEDLGVDSVDFWDILAGFEKRFNVKIPLGEATSLKTVSELLEKLQKRIQSQTAQVSIHKKGSNDNPPLSRRRKSKG